MNTLHDYNLQTNSKRERFNFVVLSCFNNCVIPDNNISYKFNKNISNDQANCLKNCFKDRKIANNIK